MEYSAKKETSFLRLLLTFIAVSFVIAVLTYATTFLIKRLLIVPNTIISEQKIVTLSGQLLPQEQKDIGLFSYDDIVPANVDFYAEGSPQALKSYLGDSFPLMQNINNIQTEVTSAAVFQYSGGLGILYISSDTEELEEASIEKFNEATQMLLAEPITVKIGKYTLITNSNIIIADVIKSQNRQIIPLKLNNNYSVVYRQGPITGTMLLFIPLHQKNNMPSTPEASSSIKFPDLPGSLFLVTQKSDNLEIRVLNNN